MGIPRKYTSWDQSSAGTLFERLLVITGLQLFHRRAAFRRKQLGWVQLRRVPVSEPAVVNASIGLTFDATDNRKAMPCTPEPEPEPDVYNTGLSTTDDPLIADFRHAMWCVSGEPRSDRLISYSLRLCLSARSDCL